MAARRTCTPSERPCILRRNPDLEKETKIYDQVVLLQRLGRQ